MGVVDKIRKAFRPSYVVYENVRLPARHMRFCTTDWRDDSFFVQSAEREVERLIALCGLDEEKSLLDIGSGQGRLAIGIQRRLPRIKDYIGVDVHGPSVAWCKKHIGSVTPFRFIHLPAYNARYNKTGEAIGEKFRLPFDSASFDVTFLYSVFTHMTPGDVAAYLSEISRVLRPQGRMFATFYVEDDVPGYEENPPGYMEAKYGAHLGPLHRCRFERSYVEQMIAAAPLRLVGIDHQCEPQTGQSVVIAERA